MIEHVPPKVPLFWADEDKRPAEPEGIGLRVAPSFFNTRVLVYDFRPLDFSDCDDADDGSAADHAQM